MEIMKEAFSVYAEQLLSHPEANRMKIISLAKWHIEDITHWPGYFDQNFNMESIDGLLRNTCYWNAWKKGSRLENKDGLYPFIKQFIRDLDRG